MITLTENFNQCMMNQLINAIQMTGRYGKEVYLEVDIMAIVDIIGTIIYKHTH